jgi:hypothetical protein
MRFRFAGLCLALAIFNTQASEYWIFDSRISVSGPRVDDVYHHLDGSGRKHIAVTAESVAVVWEDNRSSAPQIYVAQKSLIWETFAPALLVSSGSEAYEPAIDAISGNRFVLAFEQDASVFARILSQDGLAEPVRLSRATASHVSIDSFEDHIFASWREQDNGMWFLKVAALRIDNANRLTIESLQSVESRGLKTPVLFPAIAVNSAGLCVAWEDRRAGHTRLLFSHAGDGRKPFAEPQSLNEFFANRNQYDRGSGVTRVSMASFAQDEILAAWMDKRRGGRCTAKKAIHNHTTTRRQQAIRTVISPWPGTISGAVTQTYGSVPITWIWSGVMIMRHPSPVEVANSPIRQLPSINSTISICCG